MSQYPPNGQYPGQYPGHYPGQYPDPSSQPPAQAYPYPGHQQPGYGAGNQPGYTPSTQAGNQLGAQGPFQPVDAAYAYGNPGQQGPQQPGKNTGLIVGIVSAVVVALIATGVGAFVLTRGDDDSDPKADATATATKTSRTEPTEEPTRTKRPSLSPTPSTSPTPSASPAETMTDLSGPVTGLTVPVPSTWVSGTAGAPDPSGLLKDTSYMDAYAHDTAAFERVEIGNTPLPNLPDQTTVNDVITKDGTSTLSSYEDISTANGAGKVAYYTNASGIPGFGCLLFVPAKSGAVAVVEVIALTPEKVKARITQVANGLR